MLVGGVIRHEVDDDLDAPIVRPRHERVEGRQVPEQGMDVDVVRYVVPEIRHGRRIER